MTTTETTLEFNYPRTTEENKARKETLSNFIKENYLDSKGKTRVFSITMTDSLGKTTEKKERLFIGSTGEICYFKARSSHRGYYLENSYDGVITKLSFTEKAINKEVEFKKNLQKILGYLREDNLWLNIQTELEILNLFSFEDCMNYYKRSWGFYRVGTIEEMQELLQHYKEDYTNIKNTILNTGNPKLIKYLEENTCTNTITEEFLDGYNESFKAIMRNFIGTTYQTIYKPFRIMEQIENPKIKKMRFHKSPYLAYQTENVLKQIGDAIDNKVKYSSGRYRNGYDVSFEYKPASESKDGIARAWYSEEYRDCGNGHYYLALNRTHAIYWEKD